MIIYETLGEDGSTDKINILTQKFPVSRTAQVLLSNGKMAIPFENGEKQTTEMQIAIINEAKNLANDGIKVMYHLKRVEEVRMNAVQSELDMINIKMAKLEEEENTKETYEAKKVIKEQIGMWNNMLKQSNESIKKQDAGITESMINIAVYDEEIMNLKNEPNSNTTE